ncbi:MAG: DUF4439 domain-containing protein [Nocardioides sp.]|nr:DUF4439 domain-containing protein [Nocardioides sp.]
MAELDALQTALAAEHAAVYVYGALGGRTSRSATPELFASVVRAYDAHRARRDRLTATILDEGAEPVAAEPAYELPRLDTPAQVDRAALAVERTCAATYAYLVEHTVGEQRRLPRCSPEETSTRTAEAWTWPFERIPPGCGGTGGRTALAKACNTGAGSATGPQPHVFALHKPAEPQVRATLRRGPRSRPTGARPRPGPPRCARPGGAGSR